MKTIDKYKSETNKSDSLTLDHIAEVWARLCIYNVRQKKELANQNKKAHEYKAE